MRLAGPVLGRVRDRDGCFESWSASAPAVVCGVDDVRADTTVVAFAAGLADRIGGRLVLVYGEPPPLLALEPQIAYAAREQDARRGLRDAAWEIAQLAASAGLAPSTRLHVGFGEPVQRLLAVARKENEALIVISADGVARSGTAAGGVRRLLEQTNFPVVVVPPADGHRDGDGAGGEWGGEPMAATRPDRDADSAATSEGGEMTGPIVCGVDGSGEARAALRAAAQLARRLGVRLVAAHVVQPPAPTPGLGPTARQLATIPVDALLTGGEALVERILEEEELVGSARRVVLGFPADRLADLADEEAAELVVVGSRGRGPVKAALLGSVSSDLIGVARCPVLVVPPRAGTQRRSQREGSRSLAHAP